MQTRRLTEGEGISVIDDPVQQRLRVHVRREIVAFLADLLDAASALRGAGAIAFNPALAYDPGTVGGRLKAIITGIGAGQPWADIDALLADLDGRIGETQLTQQLLDTIDLVDAPAGTPGSVNARLAAEAVARGQAIAGEAVARGQAIGLAVAQEAVDRGQAIQAEATARGVAISLERDARIAAIEQEVLERNVAIGVEANNRLLLASQLRGAYAGSNLNALTSGLLFEERQARSSADATEVTARQALSAKLTGSNDPSSLTLATLASGLIFDELQARVAGDTAEAAQRTSLATQMRGGYTGNDLAQVSSGLIFLERQARSTADATEVAARQALSAKLTGANDPASLTLATLASGLIFDELQARVAGDTAEAAQRTSLATQLRGGYTGNDLAQVSSGLIFLERQARSSADASEVAARQALSAKLTGANDPSSLTLGTLASGLIFDELTARVAGDAAEASQRTTLATQMRGNYLGNALAGLSSGLLFEERQARSTADATEVAARQSLSAKLTGSNDPSSLTLATLASGLIFDELQARVAGDSAEAAQRTTLATQMRGGYTGNDLAQVSSGLIFLERQARSTADATEVAARQALSAKLTGATDPSSLTLATLASGLLFEERQARVSGDTAEASARSVLEARVLTPTVGNNPTFAALVNEQNVRASADGALQAQWVLKASATRSDGKRVFASIGAAATANNDAGESQILLQADKLLFVPPGQPNAAPVQALEVVVIEGVTTLLVPQARIPRLSASKIDVSELSALTSNVGTLTAGVIRNAADTYRIDVSSGRTIVRTGTSMKVSGAPFGSSGQFIEWYGPNLADLALCTEANATYYLKTNGSAYFGGLLSAGTIRNASQTTDVSPSAEIVLGPFSTNGGAKVITISYQYRRSNRCNSGTGSITGTGSASITLERSLGGGAWVLLQTLPVSEDLRQIIVDGEPGVPDLISYGLGGSATVTDNSAATANMRLRARIASRALASIGGSGVANLVETQALSVSTVEE